MSKRPTADFLKHMAKGVTWKETPMRKLYDSMDVFNRADVPDKRPKYGNTKVEWNGQIFDSKKELARWRELLMLERTGHIKHLCRQIPFVVIEKQNRQRECRYILDHYFVNYHGVEIYEDVKAFVKSKGRYLLTTSFIMKRKLMAEKYNIEITLY